MAEQKKRVGAGVGILVLQDKQFLLGKRNDDPEKASSALSGEGTWTMPGGKIDFGETFLEAAKREVKEETGLIANNLKLISLTDDMTAKAHFVTIGLLCDNFSGETRIMEPEEITEWRWFPLDNPPKPMFFPCVKILKNYLSGKIY